ncbi:hypothetical protein RB653_009537 [Dictyostelium firmibasis]|uniref:Structural maintenance of chromosomes protein 5 n=1 Tax=Dictyostelium firmibasis TaxID=79012 RepID=A0AAN7TU91_9MYCE
MNSRIPKRVVVEESDSSEDERQLKRRRNLVENRPTQNITAPTPTPDGNHNINNNNDINNYNDNNNNGEINRRMEFVNGSIVRIKLNNFVTYSDVEFRPGPRLNVIIGPNGSGKSSIVCAIALGLGGAPSLLGRQKQLGDFVKNRCSQGYIEIELFNESGGNYIIRRDIKKEGNGSEFHLNGKTISKNDLLLTIKKLNVQVDNLCQFLPQDKVVSFASMSPTELLIETEKAININNMYENHQELIRLQSNFQKESTSHEELKKNLDELVKKNQSLEKDVDKFRERQKLLEYIERLKKKRAWAIFENSRALLLKVKEDKESTEQIVHNGELQLKPLKLSIAEQTKSIEKSRNEVHQYSTRVQQVESDVSRNSLTDGKVVIVIENLVAEIDGLQQRDKERKVQIAKTTKDIQDETTKMNRLPNDEDTKRTVEGLNRELKECNQQLGELEIEKDAKNRQFQLVSQECASIQREMAQLNNIQAQKLELLRNEQRDVYLAYEWLGQNKNLFQKRVYGPICLEINVQNPEHAAFLEMSLPFNIMMAFIFQTMEDRETFHSRVIDSDRRLRVNTLTVGKEVRTERSNNIDDFRSIGATHYLDETFESDPVVKDAIMDSIPIFKSIVFDRNALGKEENITKHINSFFTPQGSFYTTYSKYGERKPTTRVINFKQARWLSGINTNKKDELHERFQDAKLRLDQEKQFIESIRQKQTQITNTQRNITEERNRCNSTIDDRRKCYSRIQYLARKLEELGSEENIEDEGKKIKSKLKETYSKRAEVLGKVTELLKEYFRVMGSRDHTLITVSRFEAKLRNEEEIFQRDSMKLDADKKKLQELNKAYDNQIKDTKRLKAEAERILTLTPETKKELEEIKENSLEDIECAIVATETKAKFIISNNPRVLEEYEERKREISSIEQRISSRERELQDNDSRMKKLKEDWLLPVKEFIAQVNTSFSQYFRAINCLGEVHLGFDEQHPDDYSKYFVDIRVKFRNEDSLKTLNAQLQSGGERSVSTMLYLISLQDLTTCPFRVVDEINQGMDPKNERMIFEQIVKSVSSEGSPQYFLITPKLLHDLHYSPETTVLCVFTGPWFMTQKQWNEMFRRVIEKRTGRPQLQNNHKKALIQEESDDNDETDDSSSDE